MLDYFLTLFQMFRVSIWGVKRGGKSVLKGVLGDVKWILSWGSWTLVSRWRYLRMIKIWWIWPHTFILHRGGLLFQSRPSSQNTFIDFQYEQGQALLTWWKALSSDKPLVSLCMCCLREPMKPDGCLDLRGRGQTDVANAFWRCQQPNAWAVLKIETRTSGMLGRHSVPRLYAQL